jgi:nucleoside-diphosphate-sugar epimerase
MHVFMTGASGWIGSAVVPELLAAGHTVSGIARSDASAERLRELGAEPIAGDLDDLDALRAAASASDAVIHLANKHDWSNPAESNRAERAATEALCEALAGSDRPFLLASGTAIQVPGRALTEDDANPFSGSEAPRGGSEALGMEYVARGVRSVALRFAPTVHGPSDHGFIALIAQAARRHGVSAYPGDGRNRWTAVNRLDAGALVALALDEAAAGSAVHAVAEEVTTRQIAEALGAALGLPVESVPVDDAVDHYGFVGRFLALDLPASSALTRERLGWTPTHVSLAGDIAAGAYDG